MGNVVKTGLDATGWTGEHLSIRLEKLLVELETCLLTATHLTSHTLTAYSHTHTHTHTHAGLDRSWKLKIWLENWIVMDAGR